MADQLRSALARRARPAPQALRPLLTAMIKQQQEDWRAEGYAKMADTLARIAGSPGMELFVRELEKNQPAYYWPTIAAAMWHVLPVRQRLKEYPQHEPALQVFRRAAGNEAVARATCAVDVLCALAEAATQPDEQIVHAIAEHWRAFDRARRAYRTLCDSGLADQAKTCLSEAVKHRVLADMLIRQWKPDRDALLRLISLKLDQLFGARCYRITAGLVAAALDKAISRRQTQHAVKIFRR